MDIPTHAELVDRIDRFMERHNIAPTRLGREATGEPNLIPSIKAGRQPNLDTLNRLGRLMAEYDARLPADEPDKAEWPIGSANNGDGIIGSEGQSPGLVADNSIGSEEQAADSPVPFPQEAQPASAAPPPHCDPLSPPRSAIPDAPHAPSPLRSSPTYSPTSGRRASSPASPACSAAGEADAADAA